MVELDIGYVKSGDILAKTQEFIKYHDSGSLTVTDLRKGTKLTDKTIERLKSLGVSMLCIEDDSTGQALDDKIFIFSSEDKRKSVQKMKAMFEALRHKKPFDITEIEAVVYNLTNDLIPVVKNNYIFQALPSVLGEIDSYDSYIIEHSINCVFYSMVLCLQISDVIREFRLSERGMKYLREGNAYFYIAMNSLFQDIGKLKVSSEILDKSEKLNDIEYREIKKHPKYGFELIREINKINLENGFKQIPLTYLVGCLFHHNNWNGSGYPEIIDKGAVTQYSERSIPLIGRICAIVDKFDAITSPRPYRDKIHDALAIKYLKDDLGNALDPFLGRKFINVLCPFKAGSTVKLSNGDLGLIKVVYKDEKFNPVVLPYMRKLENNDVIRLKNHPSQKILDANYDIVLNDKLYKEEIYNSINTCYS